MADPSEIQDQISSFLADLAARIEPEQRDALAKWSRFAKSQLSQLQTDASMGRISPGQYLQSLDELRSHVIAGAGGDTLSDQQRQAARVGGMTPEEYARARYGGQRR